MSLCAAITPFNVDVIASIAAPSWPISSPLRTWMRGSRLPAATARATFAASTTGRTTDRRIHQPSTAINTSAASTDSTAHSTSVRRASCERAITAASASTLVRAISASSVLPSSRPMPFTSASPCCVS